MPGRQDPVDHFIQALLAWGVQAYYDPAARSPKFKALVVDHPAYDTQKIVQKMDPEELFRLYNFLTQHQARPDALTDLHIRKLVDSGDWYGKITNLEYIGKRLDEPGIIEPPDRLNCIQNGTILCPDNHGCVAREFDGLLQGKVPSVSVVPLRLFLKLKARIGKPDAAAAIQQIIDDKSLTRMKRSEAIFEQFRVEHAFGTVGTFCSAILHPAVDEEMTVTDWSSKINPHSLRFTKLNEYHNGRQLFRLLGRVPTDQEKEHFWKRAVAALSRIRRKPERFLKLLRTMTGIELEKRSLAFVSPRVLNFLLFIFDNLKERIRGYGAGEVHECFPVETMPVCQFGEGLARVCIARIAGECRRFASISSIPTRTEKSF